MITPVALSACRMPTLALELSGRTAWAAGHANPEELASFLAFCGCGSVILDEGICPPPTGWHRAETLTVFGLAPGKVLPLPRGSYEPLNRAIIERT